MFTFGFGYGTGTLGSGGVRPPTAGPTYRLKLDNKFLVLDGKNLKLGA